MAPVCVVGVGEGVGHEDDLDANQPPALDGRGRLGAPLDPIGLFRHRRGRLHRERLSKRRLLW